MCALTHGRWGDVWCACSGAKVKFLGCPVALHSGDTVEPGLTSVMPDLAVLVKPIKDTERELAVLIMEAKGNVGQEMTDL